jgi:hypothetical protein
MQIIGFNFLVFSKTTAFGLAVVFPVRMTVAQHSQLAGHNAEVRMLT